MVVMKNPPSTTSSQKSARKVLKKYSVLTTTSTTVSTAKIVNGGGVTKDSSFYKLKRIVPTISAKENISKLDVVLEAINYIQRLQNDLIGDHEQVMDAASTELTDQESSRKCC